VPVRNVWRGTEGNGGWTKLLWRWSKAFQNDWTARADWCLKGFDEANHNPIVVIMAFRAKV